MVEECSGCVSYLKGKQEFLTRVKSLGNTMMEELDLVSLVFLVAFFVLFFCGRSRLLVAVISINSAFVIVGTLGKSAGFLTVIIGTLGRLLWVDSAGFVTLKNISLGLTNA